QRSVSASLGGIRGNKDMSRVYEALKNARDQRMKRGPLEAEATPQESGVGEPVHNGKAASRIPEILSTVRSEGAPPARPLELEELQQRCAKPEWKPQPRWNVFPKEGPCGRQASAEEIKPPEDRKSTRLNSSHLVIS